jgi:hypothetical protein
MRLSLWASLLTRKILTHKLLPIIRPIIRLLVLVRWSLLSITWVVYTATISGGAPIHVQRNGNFIKRSLRQRGVQKMILGIIVRTLILQVLDITQVVKICFFFCHEFGSRRSTTCRVYNSRRRRRFIMFWWTSRWASCRNGSGCGCNRTHNWS